MLGVQGKKVLQSLSRVEVDLGYADGGAVVTRLCGSVCSADVGGWWQEGNNDGVTWAVLWSLGEKSSSDIMAVLGSGLLQGSIWTPSNHICLPLSLVALSAWKLAYALVKYGLNLLSVSSESLSCSCVKINADGSMSNTTNVSRYAAERILAITWGNWLQENLAEVLAEVVGWLGCPVPRCNWQHFWDTSLLLCMGSWIHPAYKVYHLFLESTFLHWGMYSLQVTHI